jgi:uncharacterized protein (DUF2461 family)
MMSYEPARIQPSTLTFLKNLSKNNNREWFNKHKDVYLHAQLNVEQFVDDLIGKLNVHDQLETASGKNKRSRKKRARKNKDRK